MSSPDTYIYSNGPEGLKHVGFEEFNQPYIRRTAELEPESIYFFAQRGSVDEGLW